MLEAVARYGYERGELAGLYGQTAASMRATLDGLGVRASSSHDGISADIGAAHTKFQNAVTLGQQYVNVPYLNSNDSPTFRLPHQRRLTLAGPREADPAEPGRSPRR
jgi:hypothetical protein